MTCPGCGGDNRDGARFCRHCGLGLGPEARREEPGAVGSGQGDAIEVTAGPEPQPEELAVKAAVGPEDAPAQPEPMEVAAQAENPAGGQGTGPEAAVPDEAPAGPGPVPEAEAAQKDGEGGGPGEAPGEPEQLEVPSGAPAGTPAPDEPATPDAVPAEGTQACESCLAPLAPGTVLDGRYLVLEVLEEQPAHVRYSARDLGRCWQCGFAANAPDDAFCAQCGASLAGGRALVSLLQVGSAQASPPEGETPVARFAEGGSDYLVLLERAPVRERAPAPVGGLRLVVGSATHPGQVRPLNEDSLLTLVLDGSSLRTQPDQGQGLPLLLGLFAVADGMGGHEGGEVASKLALHLFGSEVLRSILLPAIEGREVPSGNAAALLARAVEAANDAVYLARQKRENDMGTTLTSALVLGGRLLLAHVGDCRALRWNAAGLEQLTADHSLVASLVAAGRASPDDVYTHPQRSAILRCIGDRPSVEIDTIEAALAAGDRLVLCSDGLWEMLRNEGIADVLMQEPDPQAAAGLLVARANAAGGEDNITVLVVQAESV
ncbi:MAG TPA: protein phosphatase 2C domain-containing protein [Anaerolineae bacterium]|nr:protein phosphatase 2C domain-containing protein [Anaerolineae bacterium]